MKNNEKIIAAFLVSMGLFTAKCATEYVQSLSLQEKISFLTLAGSDRNNLLLASRSPAGYDPQTQEPENEKPDTPKPSRVSKSA